MAKDTSRLRRKAEQQLKKGSRDKALALLREACDKDPYEPENWRMLAELQVESGDVAGAADSTFRMTDIYARCGLVEQAFAACCKTLELAPDHGPARRMGRFLVGRLPEERQEAAEEALAQAGKPPAAKAASVPEIAASAAATGAPTGGAVPGAQPPTGGGPSPEIPETAPSSRGPVESVKEQATESGARVSAESPQLVGSREAVPEKGQPEAGRELVETLAEEEEKTIERGTVRSAVAKEEEEEEEEKTIERESARIARGPAEYEPSAAGPDGARVAEPGAAEEEGTAERQSAGTAVSLDGEEESTFDRRGARRLFETDEETEEKTIDRGLVKSRAEGAVAAEALAETAGEQQGGSPEPGPAEERALDGVPEETAEGLATTPWWGATPPREPEGAPETAEEDVTMPVWTPRSVLPPPPVEILTIEIEADLPEGRPAEQGRAEGRMVPAMPEAAPFEEAVTREPERARGASGHEAGSRPGTGENQGVPEPLPPPADWSGEVIAEGPLPSEPALDAFSLQTLLGLEGEPEGGPVEVDLEMPPAGDEATKEGATALRSPLLGDLDPALLKRLVDGAELQRRRRGEVVMRQGTYGTALYVILRGEVSVVRELPPPRVTLARLRTGAFFGEMSLVTNFPRSATVVAETDLDVLVVPRRQVSDLCVADPQVLKTLLRFCRGRMVATLMAVSPLFQPLGPDVRKELLAHFRVREYAPGSEVVVEGQDSGGLHIVMAGSLSVRRKGADGGEISVAVLGPGDVFGEMSLLSKRPAMATIVADTRVWLLFLPAADFEASVTKDHPELVAYLAAVADERRRQNVESAAGQIFRDGKIETP